MPRAVPRQSDLPFSAAGDQAALALYKSPAHLRLEALEKEHERLLRDIGKKKTLRDVTEHAARDAASLMEAKVRPVREAFILTLTQLRDLFAALLGNESRLNRRDKARVRRFYCQVLPDLAAESEAEARDGARDDNDGAPPFGGEGRAPAASDTDAGYSATKPSEKNASSLRALFRKLAVALHPDKVQDAKERETLTSVMKEITRAYETGDVARLVEIEREWLAAATPSEHDDEIGRRIERLLQANKELRRQLRALTAELKELKQSISGTDAPRRRGSKGVASPASHVEQMIEDMQRELAQLALLRDFAKSFRDGEIDITEFLLGPPMGTGDEEDPFEQLLGEMLDEMMGDRGRRRRGPSSRGRRRGR
jgi:hypothetical protein